MEPPKLSSPAQVADRFDWIDFARGLAIIFVVIGHAWRGLYAADVVDDRIVYAIVNGMIYSFHMPLFFMLSGLMLPGQTNKGSFLTHMPRITRRLIWPLVLWTYLFLLLKLLAGQAANTPIELSDVLIWPVPPILHFWFLWALFLSFVILLPVGLLAGPLRQSWVFWLAVSLILFVLREVIALPQALVPWFQLGIRFSPFVALGAFAGLVLRQTEISIPMGLAALAIFFAGLIDAGTNLNLVPPALRAALMSIAVLAVSKPAVQILRGTFTYRGLILCGLATMPIYMLHTFVSAGFRVALLKGGISDLTVHLIVGVTLGVILPIVIFKLTDRLAISRLLGFR